MPVPLLSTPRLNRSCSGSKICGVILINQEWVTIKTGERLKSVINARWNVRNVKCMIIKYPTHNLQLLVSAVSKTNKTPLPTHLVLV